MLVTIHDGTNTVVVKSADALIEMIRAGKANKDSRVYDGDAGEYRKLEEVEAVKDIAMDTNYNQYLCMNTKSIVLQKKKENASKTQYKIILLGSLTMLILGIILRVISYVKLTASIDAHSGYVLGTQLGKIFLSVLIWLGVMKWYEKKQKNIAGVILVVISFLYLFIGFITFIISEALI